MAALAGGAWVYSLGPAPLGKDLDYSHVVLDRDGRLLRAYATSEGRWRLPATREGCRSALSASCCSPTRTSASARITASIRRRSARAAFQFADQRPHRLRRLDAHHAGGAAAGAARAAQPRRQAAPDRARASSSNARSSKDEILSLYLTLAPYGGNLEGIRAASLAYFGKEPRKLSLARSGAAGGAAAVAGIAPAGPLPPRRRARRATACSTARRRPAWCRATRSRAPSRKPCRTSASRCRCWRRMPPIRSSPPSRTAAFTGSPSTPACRRPCRNWRASARARSGRRCRSPSSRSTTQPARCARASPPPIISTSAAPARWT